MRELPGWVIKQKKKGTEVREKNGNYYLYKIRSAWDPEKKRAKKITERYLGKITPEGLKKPKHEKVLEDLGEISVKEFGASHWVTTLSSDITELLKRYYPEEWREIIVFSIIRLFYSSPLKNVSHHYASSHLADLFPGAKVSPKSLSDLLYSIGVRRERTVEFMKNWVEGSEFAVIDLTHIFSLSENVISATLGHNSDNEYVPQINLALIFSLDKKQPSFFRLVPGSIRDVSVIPLSLEEAGIKRAVVIGDKGFYSGDNVKFLEGNKLGYILPLRRDSLLIDYKPIQSGDRKSFDGYLLFEKRVVWYYERRVGGRRIITFLDEKLRAEEEKDFVLHVDNGKSSIDKYYDLQFRLGTITIISNSSLNPQRVFELLKARVGIETLFDTFKNTLHADRTYMRDDAHLEGWMFLNFISLLFYYRIYEILLSKELLKRFSPKDVILHLSRIYKVRIGEKWVLSEIPKKSKTLMEKLGVELHIT
jgi:transposase